MTLRLRPRNAWEALDLGLLLVRSHGRKAYLAWAAVYLPIAGAALALSWDDPLYAWLALWWLKPLFDRVVLEVLSVELFGGDVRIATVAKQLPATLWRSGIVGALTWRRFDLARSLHLPVYQLERLSGRPSRQRIRLLDREARGAAVWLTFLLANVETIFGFAISIGVALLLPIQVPVDVIMENWFRGTFGPTADMMRGVVVGAIAMSVIEPLYVACGFTLYLQRRTQLEGWDIELRFRQLASRIEPAPRAAPVAGIVASLALAAVLAIAPASGPRAAEPDRPSAEIREVLKDPEFGHDEQRWHLVYVGPKAPERKGEAPNLDWLAKVMEAVAKLTRAGAWIAFALAAAFLLYHLARYLRLRARSSTRAARPDFLFGLDVRPESLPGDVASAAESLAREGRIREALSLLYRASLVRFMDEGLEFTQGDTEGDCLRRVQSAAAAPRSTYFTRLVNAWQLLAYGHRPVAAAIAGDFAREWRSQFPAAGPASEASAA